MRSSCLRIGILAFVLLASSATATAAQPVPDAEGITGWSVVSVGGSHVCGIKLSGRLFCWGRDHHGQLGNGPGSGDRSTPTRVGTATDWTAVSAGGNHTCALRATGRLYCWGDNSEGQLGIASGVDQRTSPVQVAGSRTDWDAVELGERHSCALRTTGRLFCFGSDDLGQLGNGSPRVDARSPAPVSGGHTDWTDIAPARFHTCGQRASGRLFCWGKDSSGERGDGGGPSAPRLVPVEVSGGHTDWTFLAAGGQHTCAGRTSGRLYCWGWNLNGFLGDGTGTNRPAPREVVGGLTDWSAVDAGGTTLADAAPYVDGHTCGLRSSTLHCWGIDDHGQMGSGPGDDSAATPQPAAGPANGWTAVSVGGESSCGLRGTKLYCWGRDHHGQVGNGLPRADVGTPVELPA